MRKRDTEGATIFEGGVITLALIVTVVAALAYSSLRGQGAEPKNDESVFIEREGRFDCIKTGDKREWYFDPTGVASIRIYAPGQSPDLIKSWTIYVSHSGHQYRGDFSSYEGCIEVVEFIESSRRVTK